MRSTHVALEAQVIAPASPRLRSHRILKHCIRPHPVWHPPGRLLGCGRHVPCCPLTLLAAISRFILIFADRPVCRFGSSRVRCSNCLGKWMGWTRKPVARTIA